MQASCPKCPSQRFEVESVQLGSVTVNMARHDLRFTLFKCAACGAVAGVVEGNMLDIAKRQIESARRQRDD